MHRASLLTLGLAAALTGGTALPAFAQDMAVRDCRGADVVLPLVPNGHDAVVAHATDDLLGPSIFERHSTTEDDSDFEIGVRTYETYAAQLGDYLSCETPFMRVTHGQMSLIAEETEASDKTAMVPVYFYGWSNGADAVVGRGHERISALSGDSIVTDPVRIDLALQLADDAGEMPDIRVADDAGEAFASTGDAGFAVVPTPTAERLTAGGVGTGAEGSVNGARQILTTTSANRVIGDLLVVRQDFLDQNPEIVRATVRALLKAEELFREDAKKQVVDFERTADMVLGDAALEDRMQQLWSGVETVGLAGQVDWANEGSPRSFRSVVNTGQSVMVEAGILSEAIGFSDPVIDYASLGDDLWDKRRVQTSGFDQDAATAAIDAMSNEEIETSTIASVTIYFQPNQATFPVSEYRDAFEEALQKSQIYAGAVLSVEAHSSYLGFVDGVNQENWAPPRQKQVIASLKNTSTARAIAVRNALTETASEMGFAIDESQFTINGRGIEDPLGGFCGEIPCRPKSEQEWRESRRVVFRVVGMEAEAEVFTPLNEW